MLTKLFSSRAGGTPLFGWETETGTVSKRYLSRSFYIPTRYAGRVIDTISYILDTSFCRVNSSLHTVKMRIQRGVFRNRPQPQAGGECRRAPLDMARTVDPTRTLVAQMERYLVRGGFGLMRCDAPHCGTSLSVATTRICLSGPQNPCLNGSNEVLR